MYDFKWETVFFNIDINEIVYICNKTIKNIMANFIQHEAIICDERDLPWMNNRIKN